MSKAARQAAAIAARTALAGVFAELAACSNDSDFRLFAAELRGFCEARLGADLEHFSAQRPMPSLAAGHRERFDQLERQRYFFGTLSADALDELSAIARAPLEELRNNAARGRVSRDELSINTGWVAMNLVGILDREFERQGIHDTVSAFACRPMRTRGAALELSPTSTTWWRNYYDLPRAPETLYAHTDEALAHPKAIVYLTEVGVHNGPASMYPGCEQRLALTPLQKLVGRVIGSVGANPDSRLHTIYERGPTARAFGSSVFRRHFAMLPRSLRYNSHFGWDVLPDSPLERTLVDAEVTMLGPAGTFVVFDGARILHRGGMVQSGERVALQVVFAAPQSRLHAVADRLAQARASAAPVVRALRQRVLPTR